MSDDKYIIIIRYQELYLYSRIVGTTADNYYVFKTRDVTGWIAEIISILRRLYGNPNIIQSNNIMDIIQYITRYKINSDHNVNTVERDADYYIMKVSLENRTVENLGNYYDVMNEYIYKPIKKIEKLEKENELLKSEIHLLKSAIEDIKLALLYQPGGNEAIECKKHFEELCNDNNKTILD